MLNERADTVQLVLGWDARDTQGGIAQRVQNSI